MTLGPERPSFVPGSRASASAAHASTDAPPNTSPTPIATTGTPSARRSRSAASARASASSAGLASWSRTPPDAMSRTTAAGRSRRAAWKSARSASAWFAPALPPRKRSSCAATRTGAPAIVARAVATPSSACAVRRQPARCGESRGAARRSLTGAMLPGSAIDAMRSRAVLARSAADGLTVGRHMGFSLVPPMVRRSNRSIARCTMPAFTYRRA